MNKKALLAVPALALGMVALGSAPAMANHANGTYTSELGQLNGTTGSGNITVTINDKQATVYLEVSGLAAMLDAETVYPHVQHIHGGAQGVCPTAAADENGDGIVSTTDGAPFYGGILTTLSTSGDTSPAAGLDLTLGGQGASYTVERTFEMNAETLDALAAGTAVVVVHGLDPATAGVSEEVFTSPSDLDDSLPLGATSPALCGTLALSQMGEMPQGGADTGVEQQTGSNLGMIALGGGLVLAAAAGGTYVVRRRGNN
ncbi:PHD/YefM family antitoxin component YafN of YafNO toxin-antitoxin module [Arthrobacter pigmenti]|uniref:PHD/YefM family antitoxin component YafN of YafNO toxin-antitoxin module n=1 Tax=Arthrobacter pigmenti TaxID=271432 RepID=A0A846RTT2_9MICC|nr:hypothetical protein [Arthrobacter pigmenti]NJC21681.1 PHD/YefM family antitoxin component YafN of YafNO toxin-antitoxin module [Arthrobacter pigmenti]